MSLQQPEEQGHRSVCALPCLCPQGSRDKGLEGGRLPSQTAERHLQAPGREVGIFLARIWLILIFWGFLLSLVQRSRPGENPLL